LLMRRRAEAISINSAFMLGILTLHTILRQKSTSFAGGDRSKALKPYDFLTAMGSSELPHLKFPFDLVQAEVLATDGARHSGGAAKRISATLAVELKEQLVREPLRLALTSGHVLGSCCLLH
jgi:hypothetical protein